MNFFTNLSATTPQVDISTFSKEEKKIVQDLQSKPQHTIIPHCFALLSDKRIIFLSDNCYQALISNFSKFVQKHMNQMQLTKSVSDLLNQSESFTHVSVQNSQIIPLDETTLSSVKTDTLKDLQNGSLHIYQTTGLYLDKDMNQINDTSKETDEESLKNKCIANCFKFWQSEKARQNIHSYIQQIGVNGTCGFQGETTQTFQFFTGYPLITALTTYQNFRDLEFILNFLTNVNVLMNVDGARDTVGPLMRAVEVCSPDCVRILLQQPNIDPQISTDPNSNAHVPPAIFLVLPNANEMASRYSINFYAIQAGDLFIGSSVVFKNFEKDQRDMLELFCRSPKVNMNIKNPCNQNDDFDESVLGNTILHHCVLENREDMLDIILNTRNCPKEDRSYFVDFSIRNAKGETAFSLAMRKRYYSMAKKLFTAQHPGAPFFTAAAGIAATGLAFLSFLNRRHGH